MQFPKDLSTLCIIATFCLWVDGSPLVMTLWEGNSAAYRQRPTWHYESTNYFTIQRIDTLGFYGLRDIAKDHYDWLKTQPGATTFNGHCMVAAFWDPVTRTVFASSIPLGPRKGEMIAASLNNYAAPYWYNQVYTLINANTAAPPIHAEDGAYYNYETSAANDGPYPAGSMIAIYGKFQNQQFAGPINPCGAYIYSRSPSCIEVANALGVKYEPDATDRALAQAQHAPAQAAGDEAPATADPQPAPDDEFDDGLNDADWQAAYDALDQMGGQQQKRHRLSARRLRKREPTTSSSTVSIVSDSSSSSVTSSAVSATGSSSTVSTVSDSSATSSTVSATGWLASLEALTFSFKRTPASVVDVSMSLPPIDFGISDAATATTTGSITTGSDHPTSTSAAPTGTITTGPSSTSSTTGGSLPPITCFQQNQDPDSGIEQQGCLCNSGTVTETLPLLATGVPYSSSCAYTELKPSSTIAITADWGTAMTNTQICSVCTPTTDFGAGKCTSIPNCFPETPSATMQIGSSPVPVGTLVSDQLVSSISSAISALCPLASTGCDQETKIPIEGIVYVEEDQKYDDGVLTVQIDSAEFKQPGDSIVRSGLFGMAAHSFGAAAVGSNCHNVSYTVEDLRKRGDDDDALGNNGTGSTALELRDHPYPVQEQIVLCNAGHFASPQYYAQDWRKEAKPGPQDYVSVEINFHTGPEGDLICDFIKDFIEFVEAVYTPELLPEEQIADEEIGMVF